MKGKQVSIYLDEHETQRLIEIANRECRRPIDQVRYILRTHLLGEISQENSKSASVKVCETTTGAFAGIVQ